MDRRPIDGETDRSLGLRVLPRLSRIPSALYYPKWSLCCIFSFRFPSTPTSLPGTRVVWRKGDIGNHHNYKLYVWISKVRLKGHLPRTEVWIYRCLVLLFERLFETTPPESGPVSTLHSLFRSNLSRRPYLKTPVPSPWVLGHTGDWVGVVTGILGLTVFVTSFLV